MEDGLRPSQILFSRWKQPGGGQSGASGHIPSRKRHSSAILRAKV